MFSFLSKQLFNYKGKYIMDWCKLVKYQIKYTVMALILPKPFVNREMKLDGYPNQHLWGPSSIINSEAGGWGGLWDQDLFYCKCEHEMMY